MLPPKSGLVVFLLLLCVCVASAATPGPTSPDVLVFRDGNRATGRLLENKAGLIIFASDRFGRLEVSENEVEVVTGTTNASNAVSSAAPTPTATANTTAASPNIPSAPGWWKRNIGPWDGHFSFALEAKQESNDRNNVLTEIRVHRDWTNDEVRLGARYEYTYEDRHTATDLAKANAYWRHDFDALGQRLFTLYSPELELNQTYKVSGVPVDYLLLKQPLGLGITIVNHERRKLRFGAAENFFDLWFWARGQQFHTSGNVESLFLELELQLPYAIRFTDRGTWYYDWRSGDTGYENNAEISKRLTDSLSLGLRHELRENIPGTDVAHFKLWRLFLDLDF